MDNPVARRWTATPSTTPSKPEDDLTEWTNKIKAIQRAVDEDEEAEQKRLEEEIRASRLARSRRSMGMVPSVTGSDPSKMFLWINTTYACGSYGTTVDT